MLHRVSFLASDQNTHRGQRGGHDGATNHALRPAPRHRLSMQQGDMTREPGGTSARTHAAIARPGWLIATTSVIDLRLMIARPCQVRSLVWPKVRVQP